MNLERAARRLRREVNLFLDFVHRSVYYNRKLHRPVIDEFHKLYYDSETWKSCKWFGVQTLKCPLDLWIYQEILYEIRPGLVVETGTAFGGSALFLASICEMLGKGEVVTIDIVEDDCPPAHPRITYLTGSSVATEIVTEVERRFRVVEPVVVILDSDHRKEHVLQELRIWSRFVTPGSYIIVEDTNINGHPVYHEFGAGPMEAVNEFLKECPEFAIDSQWEKFILTFNPRGFLRRAQGRNR